MAVGCWWCLWIRGLFLDVKLMIDVFVFRLFRNSSSGGGEEDGGWVEMGEQTLYWAHLSPYGLTSLLSHHLHPPLYPSILPCFPSSLFQLPVGLISFSLLCNLLLFHPPSLLSLSHPLHFVPSSFLPSLPFFFLFSSFLSFRLCFNASRSLFSLSSYCFSPPPRLISPLQWL